MGLDGFMIDWVSIYQQHPESATCGKNVCVWLDPHTGERISENVGFMSHEGSFSTSVSVRAHAGRVEWSGNPSRWGRRDNVWGLTSLRACLAVINSHMDQLGLPHFTMDTSDFNARRRQRETSSVSIDTNGAVLTRVDITRNVSCGDASGLRAYVRAASAAVYRGKRAGAVHETSIKWGSARNTQIAFYEKGAEVYAHTSKDDDPIYRHRLARWLTDNGILRQEVRFGRQALRTMGLRHIGEWYDDRAFEAARQRIDSLQIGCSTGLDMTFDVFVNAGESQRTATALSGVVSRWYMGEDLRATMTKTTWYRNRQKIRTVMGLDIANPPDVSVLNTRVRSVELSPCSPPDWYVHAA